MRKLLKVKIIALVAAVALVAALAAIASGATGAYFSDTSYGVQTGTIGNIAVSMSGGTGSDKDGNSPMTFSWLNMLPGTIYSSTINVQNTTSGNAEDIWMTFPNLTALSALNQLGTFGAVSIYANGSLVFNSNHLNDNTVRGNLIGPGGALPAQIKLAANVGPTASVSVIFRFEYSAKMSTQEPGGVFNQYPVLATAGNRCLNGDDYWDGTSIKTMPVSSSGTSSPLYPYMSGTGLTVPTLGTDTGLPYGVSYIYYAQVTVNPADGSGNGLPFNIVATQPGNEPGQVAPTTIGTPL